VLRVKAHAQNIGFSFLISSHQTFISFDLLRPEAVSVSCASQVVLQLVLDLRFFEDVLDYGLMNAFSK